MFTTVAGPYGSPRWCLAVFRFVGRQGPRFRGGKRVWPRTARRGLGTNVVTTDGRVAQVVEHRTFNPVAVGSSPTPFTTDNKGLRRNPRPFFFGCCTTGWPRLPAGQCSVLHKTEEADASAILLSSFIQKPCMNHTSQTSIGFSSECLSECRVRLAQSSRLFLQNDSFAVRVHKPGRRVSRCGSHEGAEGKRLPLGWQISELVRISQERRSTESP